MKPIQELSDLNYRLPAASGILFLPGDKLIYKSVSFIRKVKQFHALARIFAVEHFSPLFEESSSIEM